MLPCASCWLKFQFNLLGLFLLLGPAFPGYFDIRTNYNTKHVTSCSALNPSVDEGLLT